MLWTIPALIGVFYVWKGIFYDEPMLDNGLDWIMSGLSACIFSLIPIGACVGAAALTGLAFDTHPVVAAESSLVAIRDKDGITGQFFLGTGTIQSEPYYFFYKTNSDGSVTPDKVRAGQGVRVYEENRKDAKLVTFTWVLNKPWASLVSIPVNEGGWSYKFYVPKGTVRTGYTM